MPRNNTTQSHRVHTKTSSTAINIPTIDVVDNQRSQRPIIRKSKRIAKLRQDKNNIQKKKQLPPRKKRQLPKKSSTNRVKASLNATLVPQNTSHRQQPAQRPTINTNSVTQRRSSLRNLYRPNSTIGSNQPVSSRLRQRTRPIDVSLEIQSSQVIQKIPRTTTQQVTTQPYRRATREIIPLSQRQQNQPVRNRLRQRRTVIEVSSEDESQSVVLRVPRRQRPNIERTQLRNQRQTVVRRVPRRSLVSRNPRRILVRNIQRPLFRGMVPSRRIQMDNILPDYQSSSYSQSLSPLQFQQDFAIVDRSAYNRSIRQRNRRQYFQNQQEQLRERNLNWFVSKNKIFPFTDLTPEQIEKCDKCIICYVDFMDFGDMEKVQKQKPDSHTAEKHLLIELFCQHFYHKSCLENWFKTKTICPCCRKDFRKHDAYKTWDLNYEKRIRLQRTSHVFRPQFEPIRFLTLENPREFRSNIIQEFESYYPERNQRLEIEDINGFTFLQQPFQQRPFSLLNSIQSVERQALRLQSILIPQNVSREVPGNIQHNPQQQQVQVQQVAMQRQMSIEAESINSFNFWDLVDDGREVVSRPSFVQPQMLQNPRVQMNPPQERSFLEFCLLSAMRRSVRGEGGEINQGEMVQEINEQQL